jgi:hypothetical protein
VSRQKNVEVFIERPDGSRLPVIANFAALKNAEGELIGAVTAFEDITVRKQAEQALSDSEARLRRANEELESLVQQRTVALRHLSAKLMRLKDAEHADKYDYGDHALQCPQRMADVSPVLAAVCSISLYGDP